MPSYTDSLPICARAAMVAWLLLSLACGRQDAGSSDTAAMARADTDGMTGMTGMTGMAGMAHDSASMAGMQHDTATGDPAFLRQMSNHHQGLIALAMAAMNTASLATTKADAHRLHTEQQAEQDTMVAMLRSQFGEPNFRPMAMPEHKAMLDSLQALSGQRYDRTFYRMVVQHHREGVAMTDSLMPTLTSDKVKQMATRMKAEQQKEITEFERKAGGAD